MSQAEEQKGGFLEEDRHKYTDLETVESQRNDLTAEEFPEGPYGADLHEATSEKSSPWRIDQHPPNTYTYENRELHAGISRDYPGSHPTHAYVDGDEEHGLQEE
ncbi:hypothetical protein GCM10023310_13170 [Paenibacillus vulneris]|uniref:Cytosolic protein n=1 Tax=Paenibacillus vulneris TaxID=1133364 RepID=A0ABW3UGX3_9BACL|nr:MULTISPECIES: hypothetical protein [unclassified Paenibacillus]MBE1441533.1 hypothetical protein [Paenibacillus sp. OAS669]